MPSVCNWSPATRRHWKASAQLLGERHYDRARQELEAALAAEPGRWRSHNALGMLDDLAGNHEAAAGHFRQALEQPETGMARQESAQLWNNLGYSVYMSGDWKGSLQYFNAATNRNLKFERAWQNIGLVYTRLGEYDRALDAYLQVMDKPAAYNNVGYVCMINNRYDLAESYFWQAIKLSPTYYVKAHENLERLNILRADATQQTANRPGADFD
jgi:Tfp pilus assembly protein PilF